MRWWQHLVGWLVAIVLNGCSVSLSLLLYECCGFGPAIGAASVLVTFTVLVSLYVLDPGVQR